MASALARTTPSRGVSRFLAAHEDCGGGFQITRTGEPGRPRLRLLCQGCGQRAAYAAGDAGLLGDEEGSNGNGDGSPRAEPPVAGPPDSGIASWLPAPPALPWWVPNAYILLVIAIGVALIAFGVYRQQDDDGGEAPSFAPPAPSQTQTAPSPAEPPQTVEPRPEPVPQGPPAAAVRRAKKRLDPVTVLNRFTIGVPPAWTQAEGGGAVVFRPADEDAELRIFLEPGAEPLNRLERDAARFMRQEHPGAAVGPATALRLGNSKARELTASFKGGKETAIVVSADGYSYLLLGRVDSRSPASREALLRAVLRSFRTG